MAVSAELQKRLDALKSSAAPSAAPSITQQDAPSSEPSQELKRRLASVDAPATPQKKEQLKAWNEMSFTDKTASVFSEIPNVLYNFVPQVIRDNSGNPDHSLSHEISIGAQGAAQFVQQIAQATAEGVVGGGLQATKGLTGVDQINIPGLGEISSWDKQVQKYKDQGFSNAEATALVSINAYLTVVPVASGIAKVPGVRTLLSKAKTTITREEIPAEATRAGVKQQIETGTAPVGEATVERPIITGARELTGLTDEQKRFNELASTNKEAFYKERDNILSAEDPLNAALNKLSQSELDIYAEYAQGFKVPNPGMLGKLPENLITAIKENVKLNAEVEADLIRRNVLTASQIENRKWMPVEMISGRTRDELKEMGIEPLYYPYLADTKLSKSDFVATTGRRTAGSYQKRFQGKLLAQDSYMKNPKIAIPRHRIQVLKDKMSNEFVNDVVDEFAEKSPKLIAELRTNPALAKYMGLTEWKPAGNLRFFPVKTAKGNTVRAVTKKGAEAYWVPDIIAKELNAKFNPSMTENILRWTYDPIVDMWRISVLNMMPRWIYNNFMGNALLSTAGGAGPLSYVKAGAYSLSHSPIAKIFGIKGKELPEGVRSTFYAGNEGQTRGFVSDLNNTHLNRPIENWLTGLEYAKRSALLRIPATITQGLIKAWMTIGKPGAAINTAVENFFRTAVFLAKRDSVFLDNTLKLPKAEADAVGVKYVNEFLNDYSKLNRTERTVFRRVLPFYNWQKFITKFAFEFPVNHPTRALIASAMIQDYVDFINHNQSEDKQKSILRIKTDAQLDGKPIYLNVKSAIPFSDIFKTLPVTWDAAKQFMTSNPVWKIFMERAFRQNSMTGQPFTAPPGIVKKDRYGNVVNPLPDLSTHIASLFPQTNLVKLVSDTSQYGTSLKRYDTGEIKLQNGRLVSADVTIEALKYFGVSLSGIEINKINRQAQVDLKVQTKQGQVYSKQLQARLEKLKAAKTGGGLSPEEQHAAQVQEAKQEQGGFLYDFLHALIPNAVKEVTGFVKDPLSLYGATAQGIAQIPANLELAAGEALTGKKLSINPTTPLEKFLFGDRPIVSAFEQGTQLLAAAGENDPAVQKKWGPVIGSLAMAANFVPGGKGIGKTPVVSLRTLDRLESSVVKEVVNRQVVDDLVKRSDVNKFERGVVLSVLDDMTKATAGNVNVADFTSRVRTQLMPLNAIKSISHEEYLALAKEVGHGTPEYEKALKIMEASGIFAEKYSRLGVPGEDVLPTYQEQIFESPVAFTSSHYIGASKNYFAHVRGDTTIENGQKIIRDYEIQSDLFQKDAIAREFGQKTPEESNINRISAEEKALEPFKKFWPERILAERVRKISAEGGGWYRIPDGKTIRAIEGHEQGYNTWYHGVWNEDVASRPLDPKKVNIGDTVYKVDVNGEPENWVVSADLGDGQFELIPEDQIPESAPSRSDAIEIASEHGYGESFDLSGNTFDYEKRLAELKNNVKTYGPNDAVVKGNQAALEIYHFYETELPAMLKRGGFDVMKATDPNGYSWWQTQISADPNKSVGAYGFLPPVVRNAKEKVNPSAGFTTPGMLLAGSAGILGLDALIMSTYNTTIYERKNPTKKVPEILKVKQDAFGQYFVLDGGTDVRPVKDKVFADLYKEFPQIPKGFLEAVYMQESSAGTNDVNAKKHAGDYGWLVGYMKGTYKDLQTRKSDPRVREVYDKTAFDTPEQALRSMAAYLQYRMQNYDAQGTATSTIDDPMKLYFDRYNVSEKGNTAARKAFSDRFNYYASQV